MVEATTQSWWPATFGMLVLLALGGGPACDFEDGTPILTSRDGGVEDDAGEDDVAPSEDMAIDHGPDADADVDGEAEVEAEAEVEDHGGWDDGGPACEAVLSEPLNIFPAAADGDERPIALRSEGGFVAFARLPGPISADGLRFQRVNLDGSAATAALWTLSSLKLGPSHPLLELPGGSFAAAFQVSEGAGPGIWLKAVPESGTGGEVPRQVPDTDARHDSPMLAFDGTDLIVGWRRTVAGTSYIQVQRADATTGAAIGAAGGLTAASGDREPVIAWGGGRLALAYIHGGTGSLFVSVADAEFAYVTGGVLEPPAGESIVGYPALVWNGTRFGLAWETRGDTASHLHLATFGPDEVPTEHGILDELSLEPTEVGQVALAWGELTGEWGLAWSRTVGVETGISLARIDGTDFRTLEPAVDISPGWSTARHPGLAYNAGYYLVIWTEPSGAAFPIYAATYGCVP